MPKLVQETGSSFEQWRQKPVSPPSSPTRATIDLEDKTAAGSSRSTGDEASSESELSRENVDDSDMDTASGDCILCSDTDEVSVQTAHRKYWKTVWAYCRPRKGSLWTEAQLKRIRDSYQDVWGHDHENIRTEQKCALVEDQNSFEMWKMKVRTDWLLCINEVTGSKIYTRESEGKDFGIVMKQYHTHYYQFYEKGTTRAMVGL